MKQKSGKSTCLGAVLMALAAVVKKGRSRYFKSLTVHSQPPSEWRKVLTMCRGRSENREATLGPPPGGHTRAQADFSQPRVKFTEPITRWKGFQLCLCLSCAHMFAPRRGRADQRTAAWGQSSHLVQPLARWVGKLRPRDVSRRCRK